jgi:hypothetical protein
MNTAQKEWDKLHKRWLRAKTVRNKTFKSYQDACAAYHWTEADDGAKWKRVIALRDRDTAAFEKQESAWGALVAFMRRHLS